MKIRKADNGFITQDSMGNERVYGNLEDLFRGLMFYFEGKSPTFGGDLFGDVQVITSKPNAGLNQ